MENTLDLNLLRVFEILLEEESATRAAIRLDLTQAAVSASLARLRKVYGDPLFERSGKGLAPTPKALALAPDIRRAMDAIRATLPGETGLRHVLIGLSDDIEIAYGAAIVARLARDLPDIVPVFRPSFRPSDGASAAERLADRQLDIAIGSGGLAARGLLRISLGTCSHLSVTRGTHAGGSAAGETPPDLDAFCARPHLLVSSGGLTDSLDTALAALDRSRMIATTTAHVSAVPFLLRDNMIATLPAHAARAVASLGGFVTFPPPLDLPAYPVDLATRSTNTRDTTLKACVKAIRAVFAGK
jgi:DNA-binding transcriptional LysR family regulator